MRRIVLTETAAVVLFGTEALLFARPQAQQPMLGLGMSMQGLGVGRAGHGTAQLLANASVATRVFMFANDKVHRAMSITYSGNADWDLAAGMIPYHQGAIDMAVAELRYGHNEQLKRIAQEIIIDQQQEIAAMKLAIGQPLPPSTPAPTQGGDHHSPMEH